MHQVIGNKGFVSSLIWLCWYQWQNSLYWLRLHPVLATEFLAFAALVTTCHLSSGFLACLALVLLADITSRGQRYMSLWQNLRLKISDGSHWFFVKSSELTGGSSYVFKVRKVGSLQSLFKQLPWCGYRGAVRKSKNL